MNGLLLLFPVAVIAVTIIGFVAGIPVTVGHLPMAMLSVFALSFMMKDKHLRTKAVTRFLIVLAVSVFVVALPVMYTITDGASCHRPAVFLLANGWNPIWQPEARDVTNLLMGHFDINVFLLRHEHIAFTPRAGWLFGAVMYKVFGFMEVADSFNIYLLISGILIVLEWFKRFTSLSLAQRIVFSLLICLSPHVVGGLLGGCIDAAVYVLTGIGILYFDAYRREMRGSDLVFGVLALCLASAVKFTGIAVAILVPIGYLVFTHKRRLLAFSMPVAIVLVLVFNTSPMITSWVNHGGPFYPAHSFDKSERTQDNMTFDFDMKNEDAQKMGYLGRFCYAYVSKPLTKEYYKRKFHQKDFNPQLLLFHEIDGFGIVFSVFLVAGMIALFFIKDSGIRIMAMVLFLTLFLMPGKYMGYSRYVSQVYLVPILVAVGLAMQLKGKRLQWLVIILMCGFVAAQMKKPLLPYPYMWLQSVQNLQSVLAIEKDPSPTVLSGNFYSAIALKNDTNERVIMCAPEQTCEIAAKYSYGPCNQRFSYMTDNEIPDFRGFACTAVKDDSAIMDKSFAAKRMQGIEKYFIREFLPKELPLLPKRFCQTMGYRGRQFARAWSK